MNLLNYRDYIKKEVEKILFIEINKDITFQIKNQFTLKKGEYPILADNLKELALRGDSNIQLNYILDGIITLLGVDSDFIYKHSYINLLKNIFAIDSYIISQIERYKNTNTKKALIYANTLCLLNKTETNLINRIYLLFDLQNKTGLDFSDEIESSLKEVLEINQDNPTANYNLALYYLNYDKTLAKYHLRKCLNHPITKNEAQELLEKIEAVENYDRAIDHIKAENYEEALKILVPIVEEDTENLDAIYYVALCYRNLGLNEKALYYLNELLDKPERAEVYIEMGLNLAALSYFQEALVYFKNALKIKPDDATIICNIGVCHLYLGDKESAKQHFELASRIDKKDEIAKKWLETLKED